MDEQETMPLCGAHTVLGKSVLSLSLYPPPHTHTHTHVRAHAHAHPTRAGSRVERRAAHVFGRLQDLRMVGETKVVVCAKVEHFVFAAFHTNQCGLWGSDHTFNLPRACLLDAFQLFGHDLYTGAGVCRSVGVGGDPSRTKILNAAL